MQHVLATQKTVLKNNAKVSKDPSADAPRDQVSFLGDVKSYWVTLISRWVKLRYCWATQGYTRPKVLIMVPMRHMAHRLVKRLAALVPNIQRKVRLSLDAAALH